MKYKLLISFLCLFLLSSVNAGDGDDFLQAFGDSSWGQKYEQAPREDEAPPMTNANTEIEVNTSAVPDQICTRSQQTSLPKRSFLKILSKSDLVVSHNPDTGKLTINGGTMVGNCKNMLQYNFSSPSHGRPYLFQVDIRKPATGCEEDPATGKTLCEYKAYTATDGIPNDEMKTVKVEPNYNGFVQCMKDVGVMTSSGLAEDKIAPLKFKETFSGANATGEVWFYCHGPECARQRLQNESNKEENSCRFYEDINDDGFIAYSQADVREQRAHALFNQICRSGDYSLIDNNLPKFTEFSFMYDILKRVRDTIIEDEVKKLHAQIAKKKDLSNLDAQNFNRVLSDFYQKVVLPKRSQILYQIEKVDTMADGEARDRELAQLEAMVQAYRKYTKEPFMTKDDYAKMKSFAMKAPLHKELWREAALKYYAVNNSAYHFARYDSELAQKNQMASLSREEVEAQMEMDITEQSEELDKLGILANDKEGRVSFSSQFQEAANEVSLAHEFDLYDLQQKIMNERTQERAKCYNAQAGMWGINQQVCLLKSAQNEAQYEHEYSMKTSPEYQQMLLERQSPYLNLAQKWSQIEAQRNQVYDIQRAPSGQTNIDPRLLRDPRISNQLRSNLNQNYDANYFLRNNQDASYYGQMMQQRALMQQYQRQQQNLMQYGQPSYGPPSRMPMMYGNQSAGFSFQSGL